MVRDCCGASEGRPDFYGARVSAFSTLGPLKVAGRVGGFSWYRYSIVSRADAYLCHGTLVARKEGVRDVLAGVGATTSENMCSLDFLGEDEMFTPKRVLGKQKASGQDLSARLTARVPPDGVVRSRLSYAALSLATASLIVFGVYPRCFPVYEAWLSEGLARGNYSQNYLELLSIAGRIYYDGSFYDVFERTGGQKASQPASQALETGISRQGILRMKNNKKSPNGFLPRETV